MSIHFPPEFPDDPTIETIDHDEFRQMVADVVQSQHAVQVLIRLLRGGSFDALDGGTGTGLGVLLESVNQRMEMALGTMHTAARALGVGDIQAAPLPA